MRFQKISSASSNGVASNNPSCGVAGKSCSSSSNLSVRSVIEEEILEDITRNHQLADEGGEAEEKDEGDDEAEEEDESDDETEEVDEDHQK
ncbi:hypothetical protein QVD17_16703 [Tagetes erecta]|uniref:Uncharacterized protein n=1 Tax=Tagetes erecta TaxID=13708 RepID=A0AAD8KRW7_TARER|nr:hypothetical protein QVD17_16703 [Tagetes erecta]